LYRRVLVNLLGQFEKLLALLGFQGFIPCKCTFLKSFVVFGSKKCIRELIKDPPPRDARSEPLTPNGRPNKMFSSIINRKS
jgi:hypothetical protein